MHWNYYRVIGKQMERKIEAIVDQKMIFSQVEKEKISLFVISIDLVSSMEIIRMENIEVVVFLERDFTIYLSDH